MGEERAKEKMPGARIEYVDLLRAVGIILMILGHIGISKAPNQWMHAFHMPLFFIISGYFYKNRPFHEMLGRKARTLLVPYIVAGLLHVGIQSLRKGFHLSYLRLLFFENTADPGIPIAGALWFLTACFAADVLFWCVRALKIKGVCQTAVALGLSFLGMACAVYLPFRLPLALDAGLAAVGFYQVGAIIRANKEKLDRMPFGYALLGFLGFSALSMVNGYVNMRTGTYAVWPLFLINAVGITVSLWVLSRGVYQFFAGKPRFRPVLKWICGIGSNSILYLCFNQLAVLYTNKFFNLFAEISRLSTAQLVVRQIVILMIVLLELKAVEELINRTKIRTVFGK